MLTNRLKLPRSIVAAVTNDPYTRGDSDISVTQLISPPYQRRLRESSEVEQVEDVSDRVWSLLGQCVHLLLERAYPAHIGDTNAFLELRLFHEILGWKVSGQFDVLEDGCLQDFKVTSVWSVMGDTKIEWEQQLNLLRYLCHVNKLGVDSLRIVAILRDWSKSKASMNPGYPRAQVEVIDIPMWSLEKAEEYLIERVKAHQDSTPPVCSDKERWKKNDIFAVMKEGRKSAVRLYDTSEHENAEQLANVHAETAGDGHFVVKRAGEFTRCQNYCNVSHVCPAMKTDVGF